MKMLAEQIPQEDSGPAALALVAMLIMELTKKDVLNPEESNAIFACAAFFCDGVGHGGSARLLRTICPTCAEIDPVEWIKASGGELIQ